MLLWRRGHVDTWKCQYVLHANGPTGRVVHVAGAAPLGAIREHGGAGAACKLARSENCCQPAGFTVTFIYVYSS